MSAGREILVGIDVGTSSVKAVAVDPAASRVCGVAGKPTPVVTRRPGWAEFPPDALWETVVTAVRELMNHVNAQRVAAVGVASVGEAGVPLDASGQPLYPIIAWYDPRGGEYIPKWEREVDPRWLYRITGHHMRSVYTAFKLLWLWDHEPEVMRRATRWLFVADYVAYRLTREQATVPTLAARSLLFDVTRLRWHPELLARVNLRPDHMPLVVPAGTVVGRISPDAARATGLPVGTPVTIAGHDHPVGMTVAGVHEPGIIVDSSGTAQAIAVWVPRFLADEGYESGMTCYPAAVGGGYLLQGGMATAGAALQWAARLLTGGDVDALMALAAKAPAGARGAGFVPFLRGAGTPYRASEARAVLYSLDLDHGPEEIARSVLEGLACFLADNVDRIRQLLEAPPKGIHAIGGANRTPLLLRIKASVTGLPVSRVDVPEAVGLGAALIAGLAAGYWQDLSALPLDTFRHTTPFVPEPAWQALYGEMRRRYAAWVHAALAEARPTLRDIQRGRKEIP